MLARLQKIIDMAIWVCTGMGFICVLAMMFQIVGDVFGRYVFNAPIQGTVAITSNWYMVGATFLPLPLVQKEKKHIMATFFADRFSGGGKIYLRAGGRYCDLGDFGCCRGVPSGQGSALLCHE